MQLTPTQVLAGLAVLFVLVFLWRAGTRRAKKAAEKARASARVVSLAGRVLLMSAVLVGVQWLVIAQVDNPTLRVVVLALPDLVAGYVLTRALTVTPVGTTRERGGARR